jgi:hypothetical protein
MQYTVRYIAAAIALATPLLAATSPANKKPALGGFEKAQALCNLSAVSVSDSHKTFQHNST